jgi:PadR family transcriptional regulator
MAINSDLMRGVVDSIVLRLVSERAMYGYEIIKVVNQETDNAFQWKEGTLYPCLHRLESGGLITSEWITSDTNRPRKYYSISRKGAAALEKKVGEWSVFSQSVNTLLLVGI